MNPIMKNVRDRSRRNGFTSKHGVQYIAGRFRGRRNGRVSRLRDQENSGLPQDSIIQGDSAEVLRGFPQHSIDLIVTSPPYADSRAHTYGGIEPDRYVEWFEPIAMQLKRVLKPTGSFVLNIKERVVDGERHTYVMELILRLRRMGWLWTEEYCWHKKNCYPGKWPNRFRDAWERCLHFTVSKHFKMNQKSVMVPMGDWNQKRLANLSVVDLRRDNSKVGSGFGKRIANWVGREMAYPSNVLYLATECSNRNHSASFPVSLPSWFIKLLTDPKDVVLDPFMGSGTTAVAAARLGRHYIGIDQNKSFCDQAVARVRSETWASELLPGVESEIIRAQQGIVVA